MLKVRLKFSHVSPCYSRFIRIGKICIGKGWKIMGKWFYGKIINLNMGIVNINFDIIIYFYTRKYAFTSYEKVSDIYFSIWIKQNRTLTQNNFLHLNFLQALGIGALLEISNFRLKSKIKIIGFWIIYNLLMIYTHVIIRNFSSRLLGIQIKIRNENV